LFGFVAPPDSENGVLFVFLTPDGVLFEFLTLKVPLKRTFLPVFARKNDLHRQVVFSGKINSFRICEMPFGREIRQWRVKCLWA